LGGSYAIGKEARDRRNGVKAGRKIRDHVHGAYNTENNKETYNPWKRQKTNQWTRNKFEVKVIDLNFGSETLTSTPTPRRVKKLEKK